MSLFKRISELPWVTIRWVAGLIVGVVMAATYAMWWPPLSSWIDTTLAANRGNDAGEATEHDDHAGHNHAESSQPAIKSLDLSPQAIMNLGLTTEYLRPIELSSYRRSITVPAVLVTKPGRSSILVSSPLNGVVTHVHAVPGEAVLPGDLLMEVRLTYEDLVETQTSFLKTVSELEVEDREITRLEEATRSGAISGKLLLERRYAKEKLEAFARSQREALRMHGLSDRQVDEIGTNGKLLRDLKIVAPNVDQHSEQEELRLTRLPTRPVAYSQLSTLNSQPKPKLLVIDNLQVHKGQAIAAGENVCQLSDYSQMFIQGNAFENDIAAISDAAKMGWNVDAVLSGSSGREEIRDLKLVYVSNSIDAESRTLSLYVELSNQIIRDESNNEGQRFITWKYRLGQRLELRIPVEVWEDQIVLPVESVVKDGAEWYVFLQNGKSFTRVPVHVRYRDQSTVVIANDGSISQGEVVAMRSADRMQMALKNKSGGAVDPHAGHNH